jgi:sec-independent protein translocase protein TatB
MIDFGFDKLALIGAVALIVIGPEKLPRVARTVGTLMGKARRYVADVQAEVKRSIDLEELQRMKSQFETAARDVEQSIHKEVHDTESALREATSSLESGLFDNGAPAPVWTPPPPEYKRPDKKWRVKRGAVPRWYKQQRGVRAHVQSGAARVARHRPAGMKADRPSGTGADRPSGAEP